MITVQVRKSFVDSLKSSELWYSHDCASPEASPNKVYYKPNTSISKWAFPFFLVTPIFGVAELEKYVDLRYTREAWGEKRIH